MVKGLYMTGSSDEDVYCGVIKINTFRKSFFLGYINELEVAVTDVGNAWLHRFTKKKIYTVAKPRGVVKHIILYLQGLGLNPPPSPGHTPGKKCTARGIIVKSAAGNK